MTNLEIPIISENSISTSRNSSQGDFSLSGVIAIDLSTKDNRNFRARTILDSGSGTNFISKEILPYIRYDKLDSEGLVVTGINDTKASTHDLVRIYLVSKECQQKSIKCYVMPEMINYDISKNMLKTMLDECKIMPKFKNPLEQTIDHEEGVSIVLGPGAIRDISYTPPSWYGQYTVDHTYF
ncbi:unnamed protein product, partial [Meganyctiphanes norvegica]